MKKHIFTTGTILVILTVLLMPVSENISNGITIPYADKILHFGMFGFLACIYIFEQFAHNRQVRQSVKPIIFFIAFAIITEILQKFTDYRSFEVTDIIADSLGILMGYFICTKRIKLLQKR